MTVTSRNVYLPEDEAGVVGVRSSSACSGTKSSIGAGTDSPGTIGEDISY